MNGQHIDYYDNCKLKQANIYIKNQLHGEMKKWDSTGLLTDSITYANDKMTNKTKFEYDFSNTLSRKIFTDSVHTP